MLREIWQEVIHALLGNNVHLIYDKEKWMELQRILDELETDLKTLSTEALKAKYLVRQ